MRSVRLSEELERDMQSAAEMLGEDRSQFIREAVRERCERLKGRNAAKVFAEITGMMAVPRKTLASKRPSAKDSAAFLADASIRPRRTRKAR